THNAMTIVRGDTHNSEPGFFVCFESLPQWNNRSADNMYLMRFNRWHTRIFIGPPIASFRWRNGVVFLRKLVVMNVTAMRRFRFQDRECAVAVSCLGVRV